VVKQSDYPEEEVQACLSVLIEVMTALGQFRKNIAVVGGNVPFLLIPSGEPKHPGTLDVDLALDFKHISSATYETILRILAKRGYYQKSDGPPFRFYRDIPGSEITIEVDLLAGEYGGTGKGRRHQEVQDVKARKARGCDLVFDQAIEINLSGKLPNGGKNEVTVLVPHIGVFLVMKGMALWDRMNEKDAFDIYYCCRNYPGGLKELIEEMKALVTNKLAREGLGKIKAKFATVDAIGPTWVADFSETTEPEEKDRIQREAFEIVNSVLDALGIKPVTE